MPDTGLSVCPYEDLLHLTRTLVHVVEVKRVYWYVHVSNDIQDL